MKPETDFDAHLTRQLTDDVLPDHDFTRRVTARLQRYRLRRRWAITAAVAVAALLVATGASLSPGPLFPAKAIDPEGVIAGLLLVTACGLAWIGTVSGRPVRMKPWESDGMSARG